MGLHVDSDEEAWDAPVLSISLGDTALFRIGGSAALRSDAQRAAGVRRRVHARRRGRRAYHGVDRIMPGTSRLLAERRAASI